MSQEMSFIKGDIRKGYGWVNSAGGFGYRILQGILVK